MSLTDDQVAWLERNRSMSGGSRGVGIAPTGRSAPIAPSGDTEQTQADVPGDADPGSTPGVSADSGADTTSSSADAMNASGDSPEDTGTDTTEASSDDTGTDTADTSSDDTGTSDNSSDNTDTSDDNSSNVPGSTDGDASSSSTPAGVPTSAISGRMILPAEK